MTTVCAGVRWREESGARIRDQCVPRRHHRRNALAVGRVIVVVVVAKELRRAGVPVGRDPALCKRIGRPHTIRGRAGPSKAKGASTWPSR